MIPDSGGAGEFRGGVGQEVTLRNDTGKPMTVLSMGNRTEFAAPGYNKGKPGALREHQINGKTINPKGAHVLAPLDTITLRQAGGGGIGDPRMREKKKIERDLALGLVSKQGAERDYGYNA